MSQMSGLSAAFSVLGCSSDVGHRINRIFELIRIAEAEIDSAMKQECNKAVKTWLYDSFRLLDAETRFLAFGDDLYRAHCRELLRRVRQEEKLDIPTKAEMLVCLSTVSTGIPLTMNATAAYVRFFKEIFPDKLPPEVFVDVHETYRGAVDEVIEQLGRKIKTGRPSLLLNRKE